MKSIYSLRIPGFLLIFFTILQEPTVLASPTLLHSASIRETPVTGRVSDEKGGSLPGVNVVVKGTSQGTTTDAEGRFKLEVADKNATLVFSFIGYRSQEVGLKGRTSLQIQLAEDQQDLNEVIVTGVFDRRTRMESSVAISTLNATEISRITPTSAADLLKNVPGVYVNSSLGEIRNTVYSRGVSVGSNDGASGYYYVSMQEDGLPVTNATYTNFGPDYFLRADATIGRLEAVRGGTASILGNNAPGGIFNYVSKEGGPKLAGEVRAKYGLEGNGQNPFYRGDVNIGGPLNKQGDLTFNIGGFYRNSTGARNPGYALNYGGQVKANIVKTYKAGSIKVYAKYLNDHNGWFEFTPTVGYANPRPADGFSNTSSVLIPAVTQTFQNTVDGSSETYDSRKLIHSQDRAIGANWNHRFGSGWTINNAFRYSDKETKWNTTAAVYPQAVDDLVTYVLLGTLGRAGTYSFKNARTGAALATVNSVSGYDFTVAATTLPGGNVAKNALFFEPLIYTKNQGKEVLDQFSITKKLATMSFTVGGFLGHSRLSQTGQLIGYAFGTIQNHPDLTTLTVTDATGKVYQITNEKGVAQIGGTGASFKQGEQTQIALFAGHNWQINPNFNFDWGVRYESMHIKGANTNSVANPKSSDPTYGGADGNPLTLYDNYGGTLATPLPFDKTVTTFSYSAGLNYKLTNNFALYGRYSVGNKAPDLDIYFAATTPFTSQNLNPIAQRISQAEFGLKANAKKLTLFLTPFYSVLSNVPNIQTFQRADLTAYNPPVLFEKIRTYGVELETNYQFANYFNLRAVGTLQNSKAVNYQVWLANQPGEADDVIVDFSGKQADNNASVILNVTPSYNRGKFTSSLTWAYLGPRQANVGNAFKLPGFAQTNLNVGYNFTKRLQTSLTINNLFNKYGVMSWSRPGGLLVALDRQGYTPEQAAKDEQANVPYSTIAIPARSYYLALNYTF